MIYHWVFYGDLKNESERSSDIDIKNIKKIEKKVKQKKHEKQGVPEKCPITISMRLSNGDIFSGISAT